MERENWNFLTLNFKIIFVAYFSWICIFEQQMFKKVKLVVNIEIIEL